LFLNREVEGLVDEPRGAPVGLEEHLFELDEVGSHEEE